MFLKAASLATIWLIILFPVASAQIYGLNNGVVKGSDDFEGYVRDKDDRFSFWVSAQISGQDTADFQPSQLTVANRPFEACNPDINNPSFGSSCYLTNQDFSKQGEICPSINFPVKLTDSDGNPTGYNINIPAICDNLPPTIRNIKLNKLLFAADDEIEITVQIQERASTQLPSSKCVGLGSIQVGDRTPQEFQGIEQCARTETLHPIIASEFPDGENIVTITASDHFSQSSTQQITFSVDTQDPSYTLNEFTITRSGSEVTHYASSNLNARFSFTIEITDADLNPQSVTADLSSFGGNSERGTCTKTENTLCSWTIPNYPVETASINKEVPLSLSDNAGNTLTQTSTLKKELLNDDTAPEIRDLDITVNGVSLESWIRKDDLTSATISVIITEPDTVLDTTTVNANFDAINPSFSGVLQSKNSCVEQPTGTWACTWNNVPFILNEEGAFEKTLVFEASNTDGDTASRPLTFTFHIDEQGPEATTLTSEHTNEAGKWLGQSSTLTATFTENNAMDPEKIFLDLTEIGGSPTTKATSCNNEEAAKTCIWEDITTTKESGTATLSFNPTSTDALGNLITSTETFEFHIDGKAPELVEVDWQADGTGGNPEEKGILVTGNQLIIHAKVTDDSRVTATTDLSRLITGATNKETTCQPIPEGWSCVWDTLTQINQPGYFETSVDLVFTDFVGNELHHSLDLKVFGQDGSTEVVNFWDLEIGPSSPTAIDRSLVNFVDPFIFYPLTLKPIDRTQNIYPVDIEVGNCRSGDIDILKGTPVIFDFNSITERPDTAQDYTTAIKYTLRRNSVKDRDQVRVTCDLQIKTLVNNEIVSRFEQQEIAVDIPYFDNPLGAVDENIDKEIDDIRGSFLVQAKWLDLLTTILNFANTICRFFYRWTQLQAVWAGITDGFSNCCFITAPFGGGAACCPQLAESAVATETQNVLFDRLYQESGNKWCKWLSCQQWNEKRDEENPAAITQVSEDAVASDQGSAWSREGAGAGVKDTLVSLITPRADSYSGEGYWGNVDPQNSLILAIFARCPAAIIFNLQKARAIDCEYINCLKLSKQGLPPSICQERRGFQWCKFVWGEIFNLVPFTAAITLIGQQILQALSSPLALMGAVIKGSCIAACQIPAPGAVCTSCTIAEYANVVLEISCDLGLGGSGCTPFWKTLNQDVGKGVCKQALKDD